VVGIIGRLTEIKDHELFLETVKEFTNGGYGGEGNRGGFVRFVIIGDGHMRPVLEARAKELGIEEKVSFLGNREDPDVFYAGLDVVALTSRNEGTPLSLIEAMANRKAVVSTAVGGVVDLLGDRSQESGVRSQESGDRSQGEGDRRRKAGDRSQETEVRSQGEGDRSRLTAHGSRFDVCERGIAVYSRDPQDLAEGLALLAADPDLRGRLADCGFEFVTAKYDKSRLVADIKTLYRELGDKKEK
jgi:glycosyltransferase involved in cell wall biosynthesis